MAGEPFITPTSASLQGRRVALIALGCSKNMVDSEMILGSLLNQGCVLTGDSQEADLVVINTCGFIGEAREESVEAIVQAIDQRSTGQKVLVAGCLSQRFGQELLEELPEIDALLGINAPRDILQATATLFQDFPKSQRSSCHQVTPAPRQYEESQPRFLLTPRHHAYLRIADGCDQGCRFCAIPRIRGRQRSRPLKELVQETESLVAQGCRELNLVAHDLNSYGIDCDQSPRLVALLEALQEVEGLDWIRCYYLYPAGMTEEQIQVMAELPKVLPYIDMPLQHISDSMLAAMNRRVTRQQTEELLSKIQQAMPQSVLRTTLLVGYPGETDADFEELIEFVKKRKFTHLGAFPFSREEGTAAYYHASQVPEEIAQERLQRLMLTQQTIAFELQEQRLGSKALVVCDGYDQGSMMCRSWQEGPDSDPVIRVSGSNRQPGDVFEVSLQSREGYDLIASQ